MRRRHDEITDVIRHHWNVRAATYDDLPSHWSLDDEQRQAWLDVVARIAGAARLRVLDVGCGTGFLSLMMTELGHTVTGIDLSTQMLGSAQQKAREKNLHIDFRVENAEVLSDSNDTYDLVVTRHVIWTLPDPARAVREWLRVLRPGGRLALIEGRWPTKAEHSRSIRTTLATIIHSGLNTIARCVPPKQRPVLFGKLYARQWNRIEAQLPFAGGPTADQLVGLLEAQGVHNITVEPIMSPQLWGGSAPRYPRYIASGFK